MPITQIVNRNDSAIDEKELECSGNGGGVSSVGIILEESLEISSEEA